MPRADWSVDVKRCHHMTVDCNRIHKSCVKDIEKSSTLVFAWLEYTSFLDWRIPMSIRKRFARYFLEVEKHKVSIRNILGYRQYGYKLRNEILHTFDMRLNPMDSTSSMNSCTSDIRDVTSAIFKSPLENDMDKHVLQKPYKKEVQLTSFSSPSLILLSTRPNWCSLSSVNTRIHPQLDHHRPHDLQFRHFHLPQATECVYKCQPLQPRGC